VGVAEIARLNPRVSLDGVIGGTFCPTDGFIRPMGLLTGYLDAARRLGVRVESGHDVTDLRSIDARTVVNAAGAWAGAFGVPVVPLRRQVLPTSGAGALSPDDPMTIWVDDGFHYRVRDGRALLLWPGGADPADPFDTRVDPAWIDRVESIARERVPGLAGVPVDRAGAWAGLYEMAPDGHAILGREGNVVYVNGSSGHGVMHSPALGQLAAEIILDGRAHTLDVSALRPSRFAEGCPVRGVDLL
jgi:sarcosine oxidase subunit beta